MTGYGNIAKTMQDDKMKYVFTLKPEKNNKAVL